jgi:hypothetical protein
METLGQLAALSNKVSPCLETLYGTSPEGNFVAISPPAAGRMWLLFTAGQTRIAVAPLLLHLAV